MIQHPTSNILHPTRASRDGMTLIELLVVVGIMAVLTGVMIGMSKQSRNQILLNTEKAKIASTIARAKSLTLAGYTKPVTLPPPCSYGLGIKYPNEYFIFQYNPPNCAGIGALTNLDVINNPPFKVVESFTLSIGVNFVENDTDSLGYLIFIPPNLTTLLFQKFDAPSPDPLKIYLETLDQSLQREITVNPNGQLSL